MLHKKIIIRACRFAAATLLLLTITVLLCLLLGFFSLFPREVTKLSRYAEMHGKLEEPLKSLFPENIPLDRSRARFSWMQPFLQGGGWLQLRLMKMPSEEIERNYQKFDQKKIAFYPGGDRDKHISQAKVVANDVFAADFHTSDNTATEFPGDYSTFILRSEGDWNHGSSCGVTISRPRGEIVYWAEYW